MDIEHLDNKSRPSGTKFWVKNIIVACSRVKLAIVAIFIATFFPLHDVGEGEKD